VVDTGEGDEDSAPPKRQKGLVNSNGPRELNRMGSRDFSMPCWNRMIPRCLRTPGIRTSSLSESGCRHMQESPTL
jgi:hypothetical protein